MEERFPPSGESRLQGQRIRRGEDAFDDPLLRKVEAHVGWTFHRVFGSVFHPDEKERDRTEGVISTSYSLVLFQRRHGKPLLFAGDGAPSRALGKGDRNPGNAFKFIVPNAIEGSKRVGGGTTPRIPDFESIWSLGRTLLQLPKVFDSNEMTRPFLNGRGIPWLPPDIFRLLHSSFKFSLPFRIGAPPASRRLLNSPSPSTLPKTTSKGRKSSHFSSLESKSEGEDGKDSPPPPPHQPQFIGQVFAVCDSLGNLVGVPDCEAMPPLWKLLFNRNSKEVQDWLDVIEGKLGDSKFKFVFNQENGVSLINKLRNLPNEKLMKSTLVAFPLKDAYTLAKGNPQFFDFVADSKQVRAASILLHENNRGGSADATRGKFHGIPVFFSNSITIPMITSAGIKWLRPYFFEKEELDHVLESSIERTFEVLRQIRRIKRLGKSSDSPNLENFMHEEDREDEEDEFMDPPDMKHFLAEMGGSPVSQESVFLKATEYAFMEGVDSVFLGTKLGRKLIGVQPKLNIRVENFLKKAGISGQSAYLQEDSPATNDNRGNDSNNKNPLLELSSNLRNKISLFLSNKFFPDILKSGEKFQGSKSESISKSSLQKTEAEEEKERLNSLMMPMMIGMIVAEGSLSRSLMKEAMDVAMKDFHMRMKRGEDLNAEYAPLFISGLNVAESEAL